MRKRDVIGLIGMFLTGPVLVTLGAVIYEQGAEDEGGFISTIGWLVGAVFTVWAAVLLLRRRPVRYCLWAMGASIPLAVIGAVMHNLVYAATGAEEPVFFVLALIVAPTLLVGGAIGFVLHKVRPSGGPRTPGAVSP
jgi:hypothetical protein